MQTLNSYNINIYFLVWIQWFIWSVVWFAGTVYVLLCNVAQYFSLNTFVWCVQSGQYTVTAAYHDKIRPYGRLVLAHLILVAAIMMYVVVNPNYVKFWPVGILDSEFIRKCRSRKYPKQTCLHSTVQMKRFLVFVRMLSNILNRSVV